VQGNRAWLLASPGRRPQISRFLWKSVKNQSVNQMHHQLPSFGLALLAVTAVMAPAQTSNDQLADLSQVPQIHETQEQRDARMQWFRDAKFGMFIHWGPCSVGQKEIGWGREANRPWDINQYGPRTSDPVYDNYGTRGGPYRNGSWGGSCHKGDKLFLHVYEWQPRGLAFDALPCQVKSARTLTGAPVEFAQRDNEFTVQVATADRDTPVTVIELTLDQAVPDGRHIGNVRTVPADLAEYGKLLSENATLELSSGSTWDHADDHARLFKGEKAGRGFAFHSGDEKNP
jgi:hypothetical protein